MSAAIPARLLAEWEAYYALEPFGEEANDWRFGALLAMIANIGRKESEQIPMEDFRLWKDGEENEQTPEQLWLGFQLMAMSVGGRVSKK